MAHSKPERTQAKEILINGIPYRYNDPPYMVRGSLRSRITVRNPKSKKNEKNLGTVEAKSEEDLAEKIKKTINSFPLENWEMIIEWIKADDYDPTLYDWYIINKQNVMDVIVLKTQDECDSLWSRLGAVGKIRVSQIEGKKSFTAYVKDCVADAFGNKASTHSVSPEERSAWRLLNAVFETLCTQKIIESNPIKSLARKKIALTSTLSSRALRQRSFSADEMSMYLNLCTNEVEESNLRCALILRALLGLTIYEVCGLNLNSFITTKDEGGVLEIIQEYYQEQRGKPFLRERLDSLNSYRRIMCSLFLSQLLSSHKKARQNVGAFGESPLFIFDGTRLEPNILKAWERKIIAKVLEKNEIRRQRGDFIRSNAEYYFINVCGFTSAETETLLGRDREHTYARYYVDWNNPLVMNHMARKLDRWHCKFIKVSDGKGYPENSQRMIVLKVKPGAQLKLSCEGEFYMSLGRSDKERVEKHEES